MRNSYHTYPLDVFAGTTKGRDEMTLAEQQERLVEAMAKGVRRRVEERMRVPLSPNDRELHWYELDNMRAAIAAISAAGFSIVADGAFDAFELAKVDLARKP